MKSVTTMLIAASISLAFSDVGMGNVRSATP